MTTSFDLGAPERALAEGVVLQDRYRIVRQLGRGGMGAVYEAIDQRLGITVALKETLSSEESLRKQFEREARLLATMQHPALPRVSDHFVEGRSAFLVMQFIGGVDLAKMIALQPGPFPRDQVIAWADQMLDALIYLHSRDRQVIHRDIKPHNLKVTANGRIALLDFGLAKAQPADSSITASQAFFGYTRHYAPLEQIQDQHTDPRSDIYALGATLYHLLTGIKPPDAMVRASAIVNRGPDPLKAADEVHKAVGPQIAAILNKAMAQRPEDRYVDASEFREALRRMGRTKDVAISVDRGNDMKEVSPGGIADIAPTAHIDTVTSVPVRVTGDLKLLLVSSARRFGPATAASAFVLVAALAAGVFYSARQWLPAAAEVTAAASATPASAARTLRPTQRGSDRPRSGGQVEKPAAKTVDNDSSSPERTTERMRVAAATSSQVQKKLVVASLAPETANTEFTRSQASSRLTARKESRRTRVPNIHFPDFDLSVDSPVATAPEAHIRAFDMVNSSPSRTLNVSPETSANAAPKFYRAADGTHIVKFPNGETRFIPPTSPTQRSARIQATTAPQQK